MALAMPLWEDYEGFWNVGMEELLSGHCLASCCRKLILERTMEPWFEIFQREHLRVPQRFQHVTLGIKNMWFLVCCNWKVSMSNERSALPKLNIGLPNECCMLARGDNKITITKVEENLMNPSHLQTYKMCLQGSHFQVTQILYKVEGTIREGILDLILKMPWQTCWQKKAIVIKDIGEFNNKSDNIYDSIYINYASVSVWVYAA